MVWMVRFPDRQQSFLFSGPYHISMIEFCKSLYCDISEFFDEWADFNMRRDDVELEELEDGEESYALKEIEENKRKLKTELE